MANATARLRRTFRYPADPDNSQSDDDETPSIMDEQEQESYILNLAAQNAARNAHFARLLLALPLLASIPHLLALFSSAATTARVPPLLSLLALTSLASTTYLLIILSPAKTGIALLDSSGGGGGGGLLSSPLPTGADDGPLARYLPYLTPVLAVVVAVVGWVHRARYPGAGEGWVAGLAAAGNLPVVVHAATVGAKVVMGGVEPGLGDLEKLKYGYKGA